jgi:hypothetical protein
VKGKARLQVRFKDELEELISYDVLPTISYDNHELVSEESIISDLAATAMKSRNLDDEQAKLNEMRKLPAVATSLMDSPSCSFDDESLSDDNDIENCSSVSNSSLDPPVWSEAQSRMTTTTKSTMRRFPIPLFTGIRVKKKVSRDPPAS